MDGHVTQGQSMDDRIIGEELKAEAYLFHGNVFRRARVTWIREGHRAQGMGSMSSENHTAACVPIMPAPIERHVLFFHFPSLMMTSWCGALPFHISRASRALSA